MFNRTGVYSIFNIITGYRYIGSTTESFRRRLINHSYLLRKGNHHSIHLQRAWDKYGEESFVFEILECCEPEKCLLREQFYLDLFQPEYNILKVVGSRKGVKHSPESIEKMKISQRKVVKNISDEGRKRISLAHTGRKRSKESILKTNAAIKKPILQYDLEGNFIREWSGMVDIGREGLIRPSSLSRLLSEKGTSVYYRNFIWDFSKNKDISLKIDISHIKFPAEKKIKMKHGSVEHINFLKRPRTEEWKQKISKANKGRKVSEKLKNQLRLKYSKPVLQFTLNGEFVGNWSSIKEASETLGIDNTGISFCCNSKLKTSGGYSWKFKDDVKTVI